MLIREILPGEEDKYNELVAHPLQSWEWGEFREKLGQRVYRIGHFQRGKMVLAYQFFVHSLPKTPWTIGYFPKGPMPDEEMIETLKRIGRENRVIFIKMEPNVITRHETRDTRHEKKLEKLGLTQGKSLFTKYTSTIDLTQSEDELLARMHPKTRYNIRVAQKYGVKVEEDNSQKAFETFLNLLFETTERQGFYAHDRNFHRLQWQILQPVGISHLLTAKYKGKILAAFILFTFNKILYYPYGASTREYKNVMAPTLLMWEAIRFGKKVGCKSFDLWGETAPEAKPSDSWYGWHRFKQGFGPEIVEFIGTYDLILNRSLYHFYQTADFLRWKFLRLKAKVK